MESEPASTPSAQQQIEALEKKVAGLTQANRQLEQFAAHAAHELQEPLRMIAAYTSLLAREYHDKLGTEAREYIDFAIDGAKRMQHLINDLVNYSCRGAQPARFESVDCQEIYKMALSKLSPAIQQNSARLSNDPLPKVQGDRLQLGQLFEQLLSNAIKFHGNTPPQIHIGVTRNEHEWRFVVRDNGIGVAPEQVNKIFLPFHRLHPRNKYPGSGLGLALCQKIVECYGGRIWVESEPDKGSSFYFTMPIGDGV
jgi:light-regulated signal transduction histidine kinase (bacteriophytochrome)